MTFYLLHDEQDTRRPYALITSDGRFSSWKSIKDLLTLPIPKYRTLDNFDIKKYLANYPIIATFDRQPTVKTNPELLI